MCASILRCGRLLFLVPACGLRQDVVDEAVFFRLFGCHVVVAVGVTGYRCDVFARVLGEQFVQPVASAQKLPGMNFDVDRLALGAAPGLVDHDLSVRQRVPVPLFSGCQQERTHAGRKTDADGAHPGTDQLHRVVNRQARRNASARAVDVQVDVLFRGLGFEEKKLCDDEVGYVVVDWSAQEDDALLKQPGVNVLGTLDAVCLFDDRGNENHFCRTPFIP